MPYLEAWKAIELANEHFYYNGWSSHIVGLYIGRAYACVPSFPCLTKCMACAFSCIASCFPCGRNCVCVCVCVLYWPPGYPHGVCVCVCVCVCVVGMKMNGSHRYPVPLTSVHLLPTERRLVPCLTMLLFWRCI